MQEERKTLDERQKMTDLQRLRHSASHVLATAILKIWPEAQFAAGPPVENGFYYDVDLPHRISPDDFQKIEAEMKKEIKANHPFERMEVSRKEAPEMGKKGRLAALSERPEPSKFKIDIIESLAASWSFLFSMTTSDLDFRCFSRAVPSSLKNSKNSPRKRNSPPVINAFARRTSRAKAY